MASLDAQLDEAKIAIGEIRPLEDIAESEWADYWTATHEVSDRNGGAFRLPGRPWKFSDAELAPPGEPAIQGEHNADICAELGIDAAEVRDLEASGALVGNFAARMIERVLASVGEKT
jgi:crotonobetainyl-CoA:carnitine CoA-transferase CaiB-like acyl-CoA transferase